MPDVEIRGITIDFPYDVYDIQKYYMEKVIECLQTGKNGVLESPTGTGKTLSLLCSSLAWLCVQKAALQMKNQNAYNNAENQFLTDLKNKLDKSSGSSPASNAWNGGLFRSPKIIYASRTHSQLNQVMLELKKTAYRHVKVGVLGSRDQLCIHPQVSQEPNVAAKVNMCKMLVSSRTCHFYNNVENRVKDPIFQEDRLIDIEDLVKKGKQLQCCPYFVSRELQNDADILFTPYNYLLDPKTRKSHDIRLCSDVVILDEGHNVEKVCEESASSQLTSTIIAVCINEITTVMKVFHSEIERDFSNTGESTLPKDFNADDLCLLKSMFMIIEKAIDEIPLNIDSNSKACCTFPGSYIFTILEKAQITSSKLPALLDILYKVSQYLISTSESQFQRRGTGLVKFTDFLEVVFNSMGRNNSTEYTDSFYKLYVECEVAKSSRGNNSWASVEVNISSKDGKVLNFWCFSPSFGMKMLLDQGVHCIILTSGTLSPLSATISEIGIPVDVQLSNPHIIQPNQMCAVVVENGPANSELRCVYQNRSNKTYLTDLGQTCLNLYRIIPGGVLVFFPSYPFLKSCMEFWQETGLWNKLTARKSIFVEPQSKDALKTIIEEYYKSIEERCGASLFAVCRGKVSEGMDFADSKARAVIIIGLPFPPFNDPRVSLKRIHLDNARKNSTSSLDGAEWYKLEAMRAVNQAVGRVIRHKEDHGAIIFCDNRYAYSSNSKCLSAWLQSHIIAHKSFGQVVRTISTFYRTWKESSLDSVTKQSGASFNNITPGTIRELQPAQCLAPTVKQPTEDQISRIYSNPSMIRKPKKPTIVSKNMLETLENYNESETSIEEQSMSSTGNYSGSTQMPTQSSVINILPPCKRRKINLAPISFLDNNVEVQKFDVTNYALKLQKTLSSDGMKKFRLALSEYMSTNSYENFIREISELFLVDKKLHLFYKDIPHFLKTDEHKQKFWKSYSSAVNRGKL